MTDRRNNHRSTVTTAKTADGRYRATVSCACGWTDHAEHKLSAMVGVKAARLAHRHLQGQW